MRDGRDEAITTGMHYLMYQYTHEEDIRGAGMKHWILSLKLRDTTVTQFITQLSV